MKFFTFFLILFISCTKDEPVEIPVIKEDVIEEIKPIYNDSIYVDQQIKRTDSFYKIMKGHLAHQEILKLYNDSKDTKFSLRRMRKGQSYKITYRDSLFYKFEYEIDSRGFYEILRTDSNEYQSGVVLYELDKDTVYAEATIQSNLYQAMSDNNYPMLLAFELANVFAWDIDFAHEIYKNDKFQVYYESLSKNGEFVGVGKILAAKFKKYSAFYYDFPDSTNYEYFSFDKKNIKKAFLKAPVEYSRISGTFGGRFHPIQKRYKKHNGTDYVAPKNTPVMAVADGKIVERGKSKYNGNYVKVKYHGGFSAFYLHLNKFGKFKRGQAVKQSDVVGYVGKTGLATGYHLCFQFRKNNKPYNFLKVKNPEATALDSIYYEDFDEKLSQFKFGELL